MMTDPAYERVTWTQQFLDESGGEILSHEFDAPPAHIAVGDYVEFSFCVHKGRVTKVAHYFREVMDNKQLRHIILITLDPTAE